MQKSMTEKEERVHGFIQSYFDKYGRTPTYLEIRDNFAASSADRRWAFEVVDNFNFDGEVVKVALSGTVAAGYPIEAVETRDYVEVPKKLLKKNGDYFALKVKGDSMIEDCIMEGDVVIIKRQNHASNGQTVVAIMDNEATIKRFYKREGKFELHPANPNYKVIHVPQDCEFKILGVLASVIRRLD